MLRPSLPTLRHARTLCTGAIGCVIALAATAAAAAPADRWQGVVVDGKPRVAARLLVHPQDAGSDRVRAGVLFDVDAGWHIYWLQPGDTGIPTRLRWRVDGGRAGTLIWPSPTRFVAEDLRTYGYEGQVLLSTVVEAVGRGPLGAAHVDVDLLACRTECIPARFSLSGPLSVGTEDALARGAFDALVHTPLAPGRASSGLAGAIWLALLGGLLLNAMPCVLPVLGMKLMSLAHLAQISRAEMWKHTLAYTAGALATMSGFAAAVATLRAAGVAVGWGFQFQEPAFLVVLCALLVGFSANLFGAFEIDLGSGRLAGMGAGAVGARRSFFDGLLVVLLATPCSAPFLGTAVGFAFASSTPVIFGVFAAIGLGLTSPHWLVAAVPRLASRVPRSGPWMLHVRALLGFGLLATVVWLLGVLSRLVPVDAVVGAVGLLVAIGALAWLAGVCHGAGWTRSAFAGSAALGLTALALFLAQLPGEAPGPAVHQPRTDAFDAQRVRAELDSGRPVFVYFTADWCLTCKVNERAVLSQPRVRETIEQLDVAVYRADWTSRDESIRAELARHGKAGVPVYLVYTPDAPDDPQLLPELLTVSRVIDALRDAAPGKPALGAV